jgi:hypothetical protein
VGLSIDVAAWREPTVRFFRPGDMDRHVDRLDTAIEEASTPLAMPTTGGQ